MISTAEVLQQLHRRQHPEQALRESLGPANSTAQPQPQKDKEILAHWWPIFVAMCIGVLAPLVAKFFDL
jgi:hypothetical protein